MTWNRENVSFFLPTPQPEHLFLLNETLVSGYDLLCATEWLNWESVKKQSLPPIFSQEPFYNISTVCIFVCRQAFSTKSSRASSTMCTASGSSLTQFKLISTCSHHILACLCEWIGSICGNNRPFHEVLRLLPGKRCPPSLFIGPGVNADVVTPLTLRVSSLSPLQLKSFWPTRDTLCPAAAVSLQAVRWEEETWLASCCLWSAATPGSRGASPSPPNEKRRRVVAIAKSVSSRSPATQIFIYISFSDINLWDFWPPLQYSRGKRNVLVFKSFSINLLTILSKENCEKSHNSARGLLQMSQKPKDFFMFYYHTSQIKVSAVYFLPQQSIVALYVFLMTLVYYLCLLFLWSVKTQRGYTALTVCKTWLQPHEVSVVPPPAAASHLPLDWMYEVCSLFIYSGYLRMK